MHLRRRRALGLLVPLAVLVAPSGAAGGDTPSPHAEAQACVDYALSGVDIGPDRFVFGRARRKKRKTLTFRIYDDPIDMAWRDHACRDLGSRTLEVWEEQQLKKPEPGGPIPRLKHNSRTRTVITLSSDEASAKVTLRLRTPYTCLRGRRRREWGIRFRETASYGGIMRATQSFAAGYFFPGAELPGLIRRC
jgi:hypothetical protein